MSDEVWESKSERGSGCFAWLAGGVGVVAVVAVVVIVSVCCGCSLGWNAFVGFGIRSDFEDFRIGVRRSDMTEDQKQAYLARFEAAEDRYERGDLDVGFMDWVDISTDIEDVLEDGTVESWEFPILEEKLRKLERL
ncbi:MAG: hypothetical protein EP330_00040 [Deltaproteobacteria bacterium]|nr:MAG: hypothetical protein EP330_00040 [Deltaproteobacteria bacterium]